MFNIVQSVANTSLRRSLILLVAKNIDQVGYPVIPCGTAIPDQFETCSERRYFSTLHYLALVCEDHLLRKRFQSRPTWRQSHPASFAEQMADLNSWLKEYALTTTPPMTLYDTSDCSINETVNDVVRWIRERY